MHFVLCCVVFVITHKYKSQLDHFGIKGRLCLAPGAVFLCCAAIKGPENCLLAQD